MLSPDLVQPRRLASAVVISSSLSSVTFPTLAPWWRLRQPRAWRRFPLRRLQATTAGSGSVGWARLRWRGDGVGQAPALEGESDEHAGTRLGGPGRRRVRRRLRKRRAAGHT